MTKTWYIGPMGDLRAVRCPEPDISTSVVRYGGVHQGLSGARTMDVTGHRQEIHMDFNHMDYSEWRWLEALHLRHVPGPHYLINPMRKNRLTPESSLCNPRNLGFHGMSVNSGAWTLEYDYPSGASDLGGRCLRWTGWSSGFTLRWDRYVYIPIFPLETITGSVWMRAETNRGIQLVFDWYDRTFTQVGSSSATTFSLTSAWQKCAITATAPAGTHSAVLAAIAYSADGPVGVPIRAAAAQVETGSTATSWEMGGAATRVLLDQLETSSPIYPLTNVSMTLLEA
jgi:hypothetical protein